MSVLRLHCGQQQSTVAAFAHCTRRHSGLHLSAVRHIGYSLRGMKSHMRTHTDLAKQNVDDLSLNYIRPISADSLCKTLPAGYLCQFCNYKSPYKGNVKRHLALVHKLDSAGKQELIKNLVIHARVRLVLDGAISPFLIGGNQKSEFKNQISGLQKS